LSAGAEPKGAMHEAAGEHCSRLQLNSAHRNDRRRRDDSVSRWRHAVAPEQVPRVLLLPSILRVSLHPRGVPASALVWYQHCPVGLLLRGIVSPGPGDLPHSESQLSTSTH
jgi:hypothetical protein